MEQNVLGMKEPLKHRWSPLPQRMFQALFYASAETVERNTKSRYPNL
jgi:hypothetical protein